MLEVSVRSQRTLLREKDKVSIVLFDRPAIPFLNAVDPELVSREFGPLAGICAPNWKFFNHLDHANYKAPPENKFTAGGVRDGQFLLVSVKDLLRVRVFSRPDVDHEPIIAEVVAQMKEAYKSVQGW